MEYCEKLYAVVADSSDGVGNVGVSFGQSPFSLDNNNAWPLLLDLIEPLICGEASVSTGSAWISFD